jgi:trehalose 6-phosphate phosphatase
MPYLFDNLEAIRPNLTLSPFGLITDIDGTISDIAPSPALATVSIECREQLQKLVTEIELVAAISGRPAIEARAMVGVDGIIYIGNHGLELWQDGNVHLAEGAERYREEVAAVRRELEGLLGIEGIAIEDKEIAIALHYRDCSDKVNARDTILDRVAEFEATGNFQIVEGKMVVELRPPLDINKGNAVGDLITRYRLEGGIYLGDDNSDLDAFRLMHRPGFYSIGIISDETPDEVIREADFTLNGVPDVARFLKWLVVTVPKL